MTVAFKEYFDATDISSFRPPMYQICRDKNDRYVIFWDYKMMAEEVGPALVVKEPQPEQATV